MAKQEKNENNEKDKKPVRLHAGHRQRMFVKLRKGELCEHELLEVLLFYAIPQKNTNEIAHKLLFEFGSLRAVLEADAARLEVVEGIGKRAADFLECVGRLSRLCWTETKNKFPRVFEKNSFKAYMRSEYEKLDKEVFDVYLLDDDGGIFLRKRYDCDEDTSVKLPTVWLQKVLVQEQPTGIILVHNHPCGVAEPSTADYLATEKCGVVCKAANVILCEHYVYSKAGVFSYYESGALRQE